MADTTVTGRIGDQEVQLIGAASEATLQKLLETLEIMSGRTPGGSPSSPISPAADATATALNKTGAAIGKFGSAILDATGKVLGFAGSIIGGTAKTILNLGQEALLGGEKISDFTKHLADLPTVFGWVGGLLHKLSTFIEQNIETWRNLSQVGATFGGSVVDMRRAAAQSGLDLDRFSKLVGSNATTMALFGSTVTQGAIRFGQMSKALRDGNVGKELMNMGMTMDEINETLVTYANINSRMGRDRARSDVELIDRAGAFGTELTRAAIASGLSRTALAKTVDSMSKSASIAALISKVPLGQQADVRIALARVTTEFEGAGDALLDMADGVIQTSEGIALNVMAPGVKSIMADMAKGVISETDGRNRMIEISKTQFDRLNQMSKATVDAQDKEIPGFKRMRDAVLQMASATEKSKEQIDKEVADSKKSSSFYKSFTDTIVKFRAAIEERILNSAVFKKLETTMDNIFGKGAAMLPGLLDSVAAGLESFLTGLNNFIVDVTNIGWVAALKKQWETAVMSLFDIGDSNDPKRWSKPNKEGESYLMTVTETMMSMIGDKMMVGVNAMWSSLGDAMIAGAKEHWVAITLGVLALIGTSKLIGALMGGGRGGPAAPGGEISAMKALGGSFAEAAGWLMKGAAIGASMVAIGYGLGKLAEGIEPFNDINTESMYKAGGALTALVAGLTIIGRILSGPQLAGFAVGTAAIAALGVALRAFPADVLNSLSTMMATVFDGVATTIEKVFNGIGNIIDKITSMRTAMVKAVTEQIKELAGIPADNMLAAAKGIQAIKEALDGFTPGGFAGISQGIGSLFSKDSTGPLQQMAILGPQLQTASAGFTAFKISLEGFTLENLMIDGVAVNNFRKLTDQLPSFAESMTSIGAQSSNISASASAITAFRAATAGFTLKDFDFSKEQLSNLADGTGKLRVLSEQLRNTQASFKKLDDQGLKNIKEGVVALSTEMKTLTLFLQGDFTKALDAIRSTDQVGLLTEVGAKLDTLNSTVASLVSIESDSQRYLNTIAGKKAGSVY